MWDYICACTSEKAVNNHVQLLFNKVVAKINANQAIADYPDMKYAKNIPNSHL